MHVRACDGVSSFSANISGSGCLRWVWQLPSQSTSKPLWQSSEGSKDLDVEAKLRVSGESGSVFLFLSRIMREKGIYIAIDAFASFQRAQPGQPMSLHIAGSGPELEAFAHTSDRRP